MAKLIADTHSTVTANGSLPDANVVAQGKDSANDEEPAPSARGIHSNASTVEHRHGELKQQADVPPHSVPVASPNVLETDAAPAATSPRSLLQELSHRALALGDQLSHRLSAIQSTGLPPSEPHLETLHEQAGSSEPVLIMTTTAVPILEVALNVHGSPVEPSEPKVFAPVIRSSSHMASPQVAEGRPLDA